MVSDFTFDNIANDFKRVFDGAKAARGKAAAANRSLAESPQTTPPGFGFQPTTTAPEVTSPKLEPATMTGRNPLSSCGNLLEQLLADGEC